MYQILSYFFSEQQPSVTYVWTYFIVELQCLIVALYEALSS